LYVVGVFLKYERDLWDHHRCNDNNNTIHLIEKQTNGFFVNNNFLVMGLVELRGPRVLPAYLIESEITSMGRNGIYKYSTKKRHQIIM